MIQNFGFGLCFFVDGSACLFVRLHVCLLGFRFVFICSHLFCTVTEIGFLFGFFLFFGFTFFWMLLCLLVGFGWLVQCFVWKLWCSIVKFHYAEFCYYCPISGRVCGECVFRKFQVSFVAAASLNSRPLTLHGPVCLKHGPDEVT